MRTALDIAESSDEHDGYYPSLEALIAFYVAATRMLKAEQPTDVHMRALDAAGERCEALVGVPDLTPTPAEVAALRSAQAGAQAHAARRDPASDVGAIPPFELTELQNAIDAEWRAPGND